MAGRTGQKAGADGMNIVRLLLRLVLAWWKARIMRKTRQYEADASARTIITGKPDVTEAETTHGESSGKVKQGNSPLDWG